MEISGSDQLEYYLSSLNELGEILIEADKVEQIGAGVLRLTLGTIMASKGVIFLYKKEKEELSFLASQGIDKSEPLPPPKQLVENIKKHRYGHIILEKTPKWITGEFKKHIIESKTKVILPLFHKNHMLGALCIGKKFMGEEYSSADIKILEIIAHHLTKALYNYELLQDVEDKKTQINLKLLELETLFDISVAISSVLDIDELGEDVLWRAVGILNASKGMMLLQKEANPILEPSATFNWDKKTSLLSKKLGVFKEIEENKAGVILTPENKNALQNKLNEKHLIVAPLNAKDKTQGYMVLCNKETRHGTETFNKLDLDLLMALCNQAAVAMDNAKLFKDITEAKQFNESILGSIATGVITLDPIGEIDSINLAGTNIMKMKTEDIIGNHYMYLFEQDDEILELISSAEIENKIQSEINIPFFTVSKETVINMSVAPRLDPEGNTQGLVIALEDITDVSKVKNTFKRYVCLLYTSDAADE